MGTPVSDNDELDELLAAMERRAERLNVSGKQSVRMTDSFGRMPSMLSKKTTSVINVGDAVGENYEVEEVIGQQAGSMVVTVRHRFVERRFTMKLLPTELASDGDHVARFKDEARATSMIGHENIVFVTDFGRSNRYGFYYVMEYLDGETLAQRLVRAERLNTQAALEIALCAGSALSAVHELGIVHRDVSPRNLMSHTGDGDETWKLLNFGLSSKVVRAQDAITLYEDPRYIAPEIATGGEISELADQFSLGAVLYHVLFGVPPWPDRTWTTATPAAWTEPQTSDELIREVGPFLRRIVLRALSANPDARFGNVDEFVSAFQRASGRSRRATIPPIDIGEAVRGLAGMQGDASVTIGTTFDSEASEGEEVEQSAGTLDDPPSVEISLDMLSSARPKITMAFQSAARLRREWRRNLIGGGIFVPTEKQLAPNTSIIIAILFAPTKQEASFPARVQDFVSDEPCGLSVQINPQLHDALHSFLFELDLGLLEPNTLITPLRELTEDAQLTSDEAFLLSRLPGPMNVGRLRALFTSLPMDLEDVVARLADKGWVSVGEAGRKRIASRAGLDAQPRKGEATERDDFVRLTLQRADFFRSQGNFLAEIETLQLATGRYDIPEFQYRIALSRVQFLNDLSGAIEAMRKAVEAAPGVAKYQKALEELEKLSS